MKIFECDICKTKVSQYELFDLYDGIKIAGIDHICKSCHNELMKARAKTLEVLAEVQRNWFTKIIKNFKLRKSGLL